MIIHEDESWKRSKKRWIKTRMLRFISRKMLFDEESIISRNISLSERYLEISSRQNIESNSSKTIKI
jgi:hypothetical protein